MQGHVQSTARMHRFESVDLGTYRGDDYFLVGFVEPAPRADEPYVPDRDAEEYGVSVARRGAGPRADTVEVVRMDTAHGQPHLDLPYLHAAADDRKRWLEEEYSYDRMKRYLLANWRAYADRYLRHEERWSP